MLYVWSKLSSQKWADAWEERFSGGVQGSLVITTVPGRTMIRVELYCEKEKVALAVQKEFGGSVRKVKQQNWIALSAELPPPVKVRESLVICAARTKAEMVAARKEHAGREVIGVPADMAFGTGHHATTATVLRLLVDESERYAKQGLDWTMGDLGCGSGILAIAARKLGAKLAWGCDFDPKAVQVSKENGSRNGVPEVIFEEVDVLKWKPKKAQRWDVVAANLFADILENAFPTILKVMKPGGVVFLSGILHTQADECLRAGEAAGLVIERRIKIGKWVTAIGRIAAKNAMQDCKAKK
jgi:ribosomal protein L11 methyltransferase